jgi:hypothetical protein
MDPNATLAATASEDIELSTIAWHFGVGETLEYVIGFGPVKAGRGRLAVESRQMVAGVPTYHVELRIEAGLPMLKVEDVYASWIAGDPPRSLRVEKSLREGRKETRHRYELDYASGALKAEVWDQEAGCYIPLTGPEADAPIPEAALDEVGFLYLLRLLPLEHGAVYRFDSYFLPHGNPVEFRVVGRERIRVPAGRFNTVVVQPVLPSMGIFNRDAGARVYLSDDDRRILVKLTTSTKFGTVAFHLRRYEEGQPIEVHAARR